MEQNTSALESLRKADERLVSLTSPAGQKAISLIEREQSGQFLRIGISGGGCNGLSYKMKFTDKTRDSDIWVESQGVNVIVDSKSALYLKGTQVDYSADLINGGFKFSNPNATSSCSCGESFSV